MPRSTSACFCKNLGDQRSCASWALHLIGPADCLRPKLVWASPRSYLTGKDAKAVSYSKCWQPTLVSRCWTFFLKFASIFVSQSERLFFLVSVLLLNLKSFQFWGCSKNTPLMAWGVYEMICCCKSFQRANGIQGNRFLCLRCCRLARDQCPFQIRKT